MGIHVIVGAGATGSSAALELAGAGHRVKLVTKSGRGPVHTGIELVATDASDRAALSRIVSGADVLYNCANPPAYNRWAEIWPPLSASFLKTAETTGAGLVIMSNLYGYGPVDHPMTEVDPLAASGKKGRIRAQMWTEALAAHAAGRIRATEARASDFYGPGTGNSHFGRNVPNLLAGRRIRVIGDPDAPHSWTFVGDVGRALAVLGTDARSWGRAWHVPSPPPLSQREMAARVCELAGLPAPRVAGAPSAMTRALGLFSPVMRELQETLYQFDRPFVVDSSAFTREFGVVATPLDEALAATLNAVRGEVANVA